MSTQDILVELPRLSPSERMLIADALSAFQNNTAGSLPSDLGRKRTASLHAGAWQVADDFDAALPNSFWLGEEA